MIKKLLAAAIVMFMVSTGVTNAQGESWQIESFTSEITINQDTSVSIKEEIVADFGPIQKHGIFRTIPTLYSSAGQSKETKIEKIVVTDENGHPHQFSKSNKAQSMELKIGSPNTFVSGKNTYIISYEVNNVIQSYDGNLELYWNITGSEWEVPILKASAIVKSEHAPITNSACYFGKSGTTDETCETSTSNLSTTFLSPRPLKFGEDLTIVVGLSSVNNLIFPGAIERAFGFISSNIGYPLALIPTMVMFIIWWKHGRDRSYISETYFYKPDDKSQKLASVFPRISLPLVYSPINGLTPSEVGTLIDERVHIQDIISEITELARLGNIKIYKIGEKKLFKKQEYAFEKLKKSDDELEAHQKIILKELFNTNAIKESLQINKKQNQGVYQKEIAKKIELGNYVFLSALANNFYTSLPKIKDLIYKSLLDKHLLNSNPETTKIKWAVAYLLLFSVAAYPVFRNSFAYFNFYPIFLMAITLPFGLIFAFSMPKRSAWGHSLFTQTKALRDYIKIGKWRHEIAEKNLFLEEMLPLAISLGVVSELTKDMDKLNIKPPKYTEGVYAGSFARDFSLLNSSITRNITTSPQGQSSGGFTTSGRSSWSGGSGFSGGSSGGGFGGGGGGSW